MLIVSKRYYKFTSRHFMSCPAWTDQVYSMLLCLKRFWQSQGIDRY
jgi:hypothetical protein